MEQEELKFSPYARAIWRRKWLIVITTLSAFAAGLGATLLDSSEPEPDVQFVAVATLRIEDQSSIDGTDAAAALQFLAGDGTQSISTHTEVIKSTAVMGRAVNVIREAQGAEPIADSITLDNAARQLAGVVSVSQVSRSNLIRVSSRAFDADTARLRTESIVSAYQLLLREQKLVATQAAIDAIDGRIEESTQPALTSTRMKLVVERLSTSEVQRAEQALEAGVSTIADLDLSEFDDAPSLLSLVFELNAAEARLQTVSTGLASIEDEIGTDGSSPGAAPGLESVNTAQSLTASSLVALLAFQSDFAATSLSTDLSAGTADLLSGNVSMNAAAAQLSTLNSNFGVTEEDRTALALLRSQILAVRSSNQSVADSISAAVAAGTAVPEDRRRLLTQFNAAESSMEIILTSLEEIRQEQTDSSALTQIVNVEGLLQSVSEDFNDSAIVLAASIASGLASDLDQLEAVLVDALDRLASITQKFGSAARGDQLLIAEVDGVASILESAAEFIGEIRTNPRLRAIPSSNSLIAIEPQLVTSRSLLISVSLNLTAGSTLTNQVLIERIKQAQEIVDNGLVSTSALRTAITEINVDDPTGPLLRILESASTDLADVAVSTQSASRIIDATASAGVGRQLADTLARLSNDLSVASEIISITVDRVDTAAAIFRTHPDVLIDLALFDLESAGTELATTKVIVDDLQARTDADELLTLSDAGELGARLQLVLVPLANSVTIISQIPSAELSLAAQNLRSADSRLRTISAQLAQIESAETTALDDLFEVRRELQIAVFGPQETGVALVDTEVEEILSSSDPVLPVDTRALAGALGGFILGLIGALILEFMDRTVRRPEDVIDITRLPNLGMLPEGLAKGNPHPPEVTDNPNSVFAEAVHLVTTQIQGRVGDSSRILMVSSPAPREGKTMMAINLARALSLRSLKVLLIDANFRKPDASKIFEFENEPGLATALTQNRDPEEFIKTVEEPYLYFLPAGRSLVPPVELIYRPSTAALLNQVRQQYDFVIIDGPPTLGFAETNALAKQAGAIIMVTRAGVTKKSSLREAMEDLAGSQVLGVVMNFVRPKDLAYLEHRDYVPQTRAGRWRARLPLISRFSRN